MSEFNNDLEFSDKMQFFANILYKELFNAVKITILSNKKEVHPLDKRYGIDIELTLESRQIITIQQKFRRSYALKFSDFTLEYMNGDGTKGEYFHLDSDIYFYGWANATENGFKKWIILDVPNLKFFLNENKLKERGDMKTNKKHGGATFYRIKIKDIYPYILISGVEGGLIKAYWDRKKGYAYKYHRSEEFIKIQKIDKPLQIDLINFIKDTIK